MTRLSRRHAAGIGWRAAIGLLALGTASAPAAPADAPAPSTTGPSADARDERAAVAAALRQAVDRATTLSAAGDAGAARQALADAAKRAADALGAHDAVGAALRKAAGEPNAASVEAAVRQAAGNLTFTTRREADLPKGFPPRGPVGKVMVKTYPAYRAARAPMAGGRQDGAFRTLFRHITSNDIAMTAPVEMTYEQAPAGDGTKGDRPKGDAPSRWDGKTMAFLYATPDLGKAGAAGQVEVVDVPAMTVVSVGVRGSYTTAKMRETLSLLDAWLADHPGYRRAGPPRYMGYNSPFNLPWNLYGEVQLPVTPPPADGAGPERR